MKKKIVLEAHNISKKYSGVTVLDNVDFEIYEGEILGLMGENGAGKSTFIKILAGATMRDSGTISILGKEVEIKDPLEAKKLGINVIYQEFNLIPNMSVAENVFLGREKKVKGLIGGVFKVVDKRAIQNETKEILERLSARISPTALVSGLSTAEQQIVEIVKSLSTSSKIIIMDEPTSTLGDNEVEVLFELIRYLKKQGVSIVFIGHRLPEVMQITDRIIVLRDGKRVGELVTRDTSPEEIIKLMVGRSVNVVERTECYKTDETILEVKRLNDGNRVKDVNFKLYKGEILGVTGLVGAGKTEMVRNIFGANKIKDGEVRIKSKKIKINSPDQAIKAGIAMVPEDRKNHGLVLEQTVRNNICLASIKKLSKLSIMNQDKEFELCSKSIEAMNIKTKDIDVEVRTLSGGNQQKVVLSKWVSTNPKILILDEPTRGVDVNAKSEIHSIIGQMAKEGISIIMISSDLPEVLAICDRILVMVEGRLVKEFQHGEATQELIMECCSIQ